MGMALVSCQRDGEAQQDSSTAVLGISPLVRLWLLRILVPLGLHRKFILDKEFFDNDLAEAIGLGGQFELPGWDFSATELRAKLRKLHQEAERDKSAAQLPERLATNIGRLRTLLNLSDIDCRIVEFVVLQRREPLLEVAENLLGELSTRKVLQTLAVALGYSEFDIRASLEGKGEVDRRIVVVHVARDKSDHVEHEIIWKYADSILELEMRSEEMAIFRQYWQSIKIISILIAVALLFDSERFTVKVKNESMPDEMGEIFS